jgi:outer membrane lipoprotein-sorting protein
MKKIWLLIISALSCVKACDFKDAVPPLKEGELLQINFTQTKKITGIPKNLVSSGVVFLTKSKGLRWETDKPFKQIMLIDKTGIYTIVQDKKELIAPNKNQQANKISDILSRILNGNFDTLDIFNVTDAKINGHSWTKILTPKTNTVNLFKSITIEGQTGINKVTIERVNGDIEILDFYGQKLYAPSAQYLGKFK